MAGTRNSSPQLLFGAFLALVLTLGACRSGGDSVDAEASPATESSASSFDAPAFDQDLSFSRAVEPFENEVVAVTVQDVEGERIDIIDLVTGEVVASSPTMIQGMFASAASVDGVVYITDERSPGSRQLIRVDAAGFETLEFEATGWIDHRTTSDGPALLTRDDEVATEFLRFGDDGVIDRYTFGEGMFVETVGDRIAVTPPDYNGNIWLVDDEMNVIDSGNVGQMQNRPGLVDEDTMRIRRDDEELIVDLATWETTQHLPAGALTETTQSHEFGDGWVADLTDQVLTIIDPDGETRLEHPTGPISHFDVFAHPEDDHALVTFRTCTSREGTVCESEPDAGNGGDETGDEDEPYVAPAYLEAYRFDMGTAELSSLDVVQNTSIAILAIESGWFAASVDETVTTIMSISNDGAVENLDEFVGDVRDHTEQYVLPVSQGVFSIDNHDLSMVLLLTEDGVESVPGLALTNGETWRDFTDRFHHLG